MISYYAIFGKTAEAIEVEFPDLQGCVTFGRTKDEAMENASNVLAGWLANAEPQFVKEPSSKEFTDVRELQGQLGVSMITKADESSTGPASFMMADPDGNTILVDQHV